MPRIRSIKPDFYDDERLGALPVPVRFLFIGLWVFADDDGVVKANLKWLKSKIFPYDDDMRIGTLEQQLLALSKSRMLVPFTYNGENYYVIRNFKKHQRIDKPYPSAVPQDVISEALAPFQEHSQNVPRTFQERSRPDMDMEKDMEKEKEDTSCAEPNKIRPAPETDASPVFITLELHDNSEFPITESIIAKFTPLFPAVDVRQQFREMSSWCITHKTQRKTKTGIMKFINSWLSREQNRPKISSNGASNGNTNSTTAKWGERSEPTFEQLQKDTERRIAIAEEFRRSKVANTPFQLTGHGAGN